MDYTLTRIDPNGENDPLPPAETGDRHRPLEQEVQ